LRGIDLEIEPGRVVGVLGPSGAGKTTLFRVLVGELVPQRGSVVMFGQEVTRWPLWRRARLGLGYVPQTPSVLTELTVLQNIMTFSRVAHVRDAEPVECARLFGLDHRSDLRAGELSGGERRRLELLRALLPKPRVLVLDEPFAAVDPASVKLIAQHIRAAAADGCAIVLADHRVREALSVCDDASLLVDGRIVAASTPEHFADHPAVRERYLQ
jgi:lipopolysaccharide export system ATP-binding protein